jgi:hypothetical protein
MELDPKHRHNPDEDPGSGPDPGSGLDPNHKHRHNPAGQPGSEGGRRPLALQKAKDPEHAVAIAICMLAKTYGSASYELVSRRTQALREQYQVAELDERMSWGLGG